MSIILMCCLGNKLYELHAACIWKTPDMVRSIGSSLSHCPTPPEYKFFITFTNASFSCTAVYTLVKWSWFNRLISKCPGATEKVPSWHNHQCRQDNILAACYSLHLLLFSQTPDFVVLANTIFLVVYALTIRGKMIATILTTSINCDIL